MIDLTEKDVKKLWKLLAEYYKKRPEETAERLLAWTLALEPFSYADIRAAALAHARESEYYPNIAELTKHLPKPVVAPVETANRAGEAWAAHIDAGHAKDARDEYGNVSRYAREHGLTWMEAKKKLTEV